MGGLQKTGPALGPVWGGISTRPGGGPERGPGPPGGALKKGVYVVGCGAMALLGCLTKINMGWLYCL